VAPIAAAKPVKPKKSVEVEQQAPAAPTEPIHDDIAIERDEDTAHPLLIRDTEVPTLFDAAEEESAADLGLDDDGVAADDASRWKRDRPSPRDTVSASAASANQFRSARQEERTYGAPLDSDVLATPAERPRPAILPVAFGVILALLIGYAFGYWRGGTETTSPPTASTETPAATTPAPAPAAGQPPQQSGRAYSEQSVAAPRSSAATPTGEAPPVPGDAPAPAPSREAASPAPPVVSTARLTVLSTPSRAGVTINGKWRGRTPLTLDALPMGKYTIRVVQPGFNASNEDVTLSTRQPMRTVSVRLQPVNARTATPPPAPSRSSASGRTTSSRETATPAYAGTIYVDSRPRGATILLDGKSVGTTPASIPDVPVGSHVVRLELTDHRAWTTSTRVTAGEQTRVTGSLELIR
jgi:hypothetical protein